MTNEIDKSVQAFEERMRVVVSEAVKMERRRGIVLGCILALSTFILGVLVGLRWIPV